MKTLSKTKLLAGASAAALGLGMAFAPAASAFNEVNWTWNADITEVVTKTVDINIVLDPTGMVMLEDLQVSIGDITAESYVSNVYNNQPSGGGSGQQEVTFDLGELSLDSERIQTSGVNGNHTATASFQFDTTQTGFQSASLLDASGAASETYMTPQQFWADGGGTIPLGTVTFLVDVTVDPSDSYDALTELPEVVSAATAVGNNTTISADTAVQLHEGQFAFGDGNVDGNSNAVLLAALLGVELAEAGVNSNLVGAGVLGTLAILGALEKAEISATSGVSNIHNATVDSSATAVANNLTATVEATGDDRLLIGDVVQFAYADVSALSSVNGVYLNNYTNLGMLDRPIVSSVATAVGNNKSITVSAPAVSVAP